MGEWAHRDVSVSIDAAMAWGLVVAGVAVEGMCALHLIPMRFWLIGQMALILGCTLHVTRCLRDRQAAVQNAFEFGQKKAAVRELRPKR